MAFDYSAWRRARWPDLAFVIMKTFGHGVWTFTWDGAPTAELHISHELENDGNLRLLPWDIVKVRDMDSYGVWRRVQ
jgi:hypothetical protein